MDVESLSSDLSDPESGDSDSDFYIVPIPDCFNPTLPLSKSASTSIIIKKGQPLHQYPSQCISQLDLYPFYDAHLMFKMPCGVLNYIL